MASQLETACLPESAGLHQTTGRYEDGCIDLLCKQESMLSELSKARKSRRMLDALGLMRDMLVEFLGFAEFNFSSLQLQRTKRRLSDVNRRLNTLEYLIDAQSFKLVKRLVRKSVLDNESARVADEELCNEYVEFCRHFFQVCLHRVSEDSTIREQFLQSTDAFLLELEQKW